MFLRRRGFLAGLGAILAAPAIIRTPGLLMPVKPAIDAPPALVDAWEMRMMAQKHFLATGNLPGWFNPVQCAPASSVFGGVL